MVCNVGFKEAKKDIAILADLYYERNIFQTLPHAHKATQGESTWLANYCYGV
jgi:hypothetical protein